MVHISHMVIVPEVEKMVYIYMVIVPEVSLKVSLLNFSF